MPSFVIARVTTNDAGFPEYHFSAKPTYEFLTRCDLAVFVPTDNYFKVMGHRWAPPKPANWEPAK